MPSARAHTSGAAGVAGNRVPFESAASELVDEAAHPIEQLQLLDQKIRELESLGEVDAVVECRIKQKALQQVLVYLYGFPLQPLVRAQIALAEAYAAGGYFRQGHEHLAKAREVSAGGIYDDGQCQRLQVDILVAEGAIRLAQAHLETSESALLEAARLVREVYGDMDLRAARIHCMLGKIARQRGQHAGAIDHFGAAWEVHEFISGPEHEETLRMLLCLAESEYLDGQADEAIARQSKVVATLCDLNVLPSLLVDSYTQLARWLESKGQDHDALEALKSAERVVTENLGPEDAKAVEVKRDVALLHLKLGEHETALQYLNDVHYYERRLHGSQSLNVARTLKALGTVHMVRRNLDDAEQCLLQALRIFEADHPNHVPIVRDIHTKMASISAMIAGNA
eukprot:TRINITY_DN48310_c0_g1_i1.p1 TRINITY_DN48310_c0_g1~~TRINITY_DN48310_c0_g1_i1.p1  ORF type:complete len:398 (+),score=68.77 TRINITY_DN48310_c0_g1_i1:131-1324(+)